MRLYLFFLLIIVKVLFYLFYCMLLIMRKSITSRKTHIEIYKLKWVFIYILLLIMLSSFSILIDLGSYFYAATIMFFMLLIYILSEAQLNKKFFSRLQSIYLFLTSAFILFICSLLYNLLISSLYESYIEITGIINPLFIGNGLLPNNLIIFSTIVLIFLVFIIYLIVSIYFPFVIFEAFHKKNKIDSSIMRVISFILILFLSLYSYHIVNKKYNDEDSINSVIVYFLYNYQYVDNYIGSGKYICKNLSIEELSKNEFYNSRKIKEVKVYPLFSEDRASYVMMLEDNRGNIEYKFDISECHKKLL